MPCIKDPLSFYFSPLVFIERLRIQVYDCDHEKEGTDLECTILLLAARTDGCPPKFAHNQQTYFT